MRRLTWLPGLALCAALSLGPAGAQERPSAETPPNAGTEVGTDAGAAGAPVIDEEAMSILTRMAEALSQAPRFSTTVRAAYDVIQDSGQMIAFGERLSITLSRPDRLRVELQESDGERKLMTFDGKAITVFDPAENVYGQTEKDGSVDDAIHSLLQDLQVRLPLAMLLVSTLPAELDRRIVALDYVERDILTPIPSDHLAGRTAEVDFQIWVAAEGAPLPQRLIITYGAEDGAPQYRADFSDWNMEPDVAPAQLAFQPPGGAERIPFLVRVRRAGSDEPQRPGEVPDETPEASGNSGGSSK